MQENETTKIMQEIKKFGKDFAKINLVYLEVGERSSLTPQEIKSSLKKLAFWDAYITVKQSKVQCNCGYLGRAKIFERGPGYCLFNCPKCAKTPKVLEGNDIQ